jgi:antitoxin VapB
VTVKGTSRAVAEADGGARSRYVLVQVLMGSTESLVPLHHLRYHRSMALNIKDPETEQLAAEVAMLTGKTKTGAVRYALRQVLESLSRPTVRQREERLTRFLEEEIWPLIPPDQLGKPLSKAEREQILGFGEDGV